MRILGKGKIAVLAAMAFFAGCDAAPKSETDSLDNFARKAAAPVTKNACSGSNEVITGLKADGDAIASARKSARRRART